jgi:CBS domain-containing protein
MQLSNPFQQCLHVTPAKQILRTTKIVFLKSTDSIYDAVKRFHEANLVAAPVLSSQNACLGFVDMLDICMYWVSLMNSDNYAPEGEAMNTMLQYVIDKSTKDPFVIVHEHNPLESVADLFGAGVHRVLLFNEKTEITGLLTQTDVIQFLANLEIPGEQEKFNEMTSIPVTSMGIPLAPAICISRKANVFEAIRRAAREKVRALAIVDDGTGELVGNFSTSDLKAFSKAIKPSYSDTVVQYLSQHSQPSLDPVTISSASTFGDVLSLFSNRHLHRVWIVNQTGQPTGVLTQTDVFRIVKSFAMMME